MVGEAKDHTVPSLKARYYSAPVIKLVVGAEKEELVVHKSVLCSSSPFFINALKEEWARHRPEADKIEFFHVEPEIMNAYVHWLYGGTLPRPPESSHEDAIDKPWVWINMDTIQIFLAKAYVFGEELMDIQLKNIVLETYFAFASKEGCLFNGEATEIIYNGTAHGSLARKFLVDCYVWGSNELNAVIWTSGFDACPRDFFVDCMTAFVKTKTDKRTLGPYPWEADPGSYYEKERPSP